MKNLTFLNGVFVALISSFIGSLAYFILSSLFADNVVIRLVISGLSTAYIFYLLNKSNERLGRIIVVTIWSVITISTWLFWPPAAFFVLIHLVSIWLIRSLYFYSSLFSSLADLALIILGVAVAFWTASHTNSLFLTIWCFFLSQALFVMIPRSMKTSKTKTSINNSAADFQHAYRAAESAVRKLSSQQ
jgi:hypothetical protein